MIIIWLYIPLAAFGCYTTYQNWRGGEGCFWLVMSIVWAVIGLTAFAVPFLTP